ncbi:MAG: immunoglobulin domain-containing protein [Phycisphaerae bacterium]|nr:immunoglobulin domain-containing protein [Phycisphaerae bacterium]
MRNTPLSGAGLLSVAALLSAAPALAAGSWEFTTSLPVGKTSSFAVVWNGDVYVVGGAPWRNGNDKDGSVFRLADGVWSEAAPLTGMGPIINQVGGVDSLNRIIVFAGHDSTNGDLGSARAYTPVDGTTEELTDAINYAFDNVATAVDGQHRIYRMGGGPGASGFNYGGVARYDGAADSWQALAYLPYTRASVATAYDGQGRIWGFGGYTSFGLPRLYDTIRYDIATDTWTTLGGSYLPVQTSNAKAVTGADGRVYVIGGLIGTTTAGTSTANVWILENTANPGPLVAGLPLNVARHDFAAVLAPDKFIYVIGGNSTFGDVSTSVERIYTGECPWIQSQSGNATVDPGATLTLTVDAAGDAPLTYQWSRDGVDLANGPTGTGSVVAGATSTTLTITNVSAADQGTYLVSVTNPCTTAPGEEITVTVGGSLPGDYNHDGHVDGADLGQLLGAWGTSNAAIDLTGDGVVNGADLGALLGYWG